MDDQQKEQFLKAFEANHAARLEKSKHERERAEKAIYAAAGLKELIVSSLRDAGRYETAEYISKEIERRMENLMIRSSGYTNSREGQEFGDGVTVRRE